MLLLTDRSEGLGWNLSFAHKAEDVTSPGLHSHAPRWDLGCSPVCVSSEEERLPLTPCYLFIFWKAPVSPKGIKCLPNKAKHALKLSVKQGFHVAPSASIQQVFECLFFARCYVRHKRCKTEMVSPVWNLNSSGRRQRTITHTRLWWLCYVL